MSIDFQKMPHEGVRSLIPYKPGKSIEELAGERNITDIIKLASNENPLGCSPMAMNAIRTMSAQHLATYPSPINHPLMPKLASKLNISVDRLFLGNGSDSLYTHLLNCFVLHSEKHILVHDFSFSTYEIQANTYKIPVHHVPIKANFEVDVDQLINSCTDKTALIFLANPSNPTGTLTPQNEIKRLLEHIPASTLLVLDEAYYEFAVDQLNCNSIDWLDEHPNLIITRTFSKIYGLAGLRIGYVLAAPSIISLLQRVQLPFAVNQVALTAAYAALDDEAFLEKTLEVNKNGLSQMRAGLDELGLSYLPSACNFLTIDCQEDSLVLYNYLLDNGIIVRPLHPYKMNHYLRITIGTEQQNVRVLKALHTYYSRNLNDK